jgi:hypothetical protein
VAEDKTPRTAEKWTTPRVISGPFSVRVNGVTERREVAWLRRMQLHCPPVCAPIPARRDLRLSAKFVNAINGSRT